MLGRRDGGVRQDHQQHYHTVGHPIFLDSLDCHGFLDFTVVHPFPLDSPQGFAFVEFKDHPSAAKAYKEAQGVEMEGAPSPSGFWVSLAHSATGVFPHKTLLVFLGGGFLINCSDGGPLWGGAVFLWGEPSPYLSRV